MVPVSQASTLTRKTPSEVWFYSSHLDVFVPIDDQFNLSYEIFERISSSITNILELIKEISSTYIMKEEAASFEIKWAYLDRTNENCIVLRFFFELLSKQGLTAGDAFVIAIRNPEEIGANTINYLNNIVKRHRLIEVIQPHFLNQLKVKISKR